MEDRPYYRTIVVSDIHLGTTHSKVDQISDFLSRVDCGRLILNGDIIDGWHLQKSGISKWKPAHTHFFKIIMKMMEKHGTEIIYIRSIWKGNHILIEFSPMVANARVRLQSKLLSQDIRISP